MRTDKKKIIPVLLLIVVLGLFTFFWLREGREESSDSIFLSGNIELTTMNLAFTVAEEGLQLAQQELEQARRRYQAGITSSLEVTDAQTRLERARENQITALFDYNLERINLGEAMGTIRSMIQ